MYMILLVKSERITRIFRLIVVVFVGHKGGNMFKLHSEFKPTGDQPQAIDKLVDGINRGEKFQTLLGVTGSRKNFHNGEYN